MSYLTWADLKDWYLTLSGTNAEWERYKADNPDKMSTLWVENYRNGGGGGLFSYWGAVTALREAAFCIASAAGLLIENQMTLLDDRPCNVDPPKLRAVLRPQDSAGADSEIVLEAFSQRVLTRKEFRKGKRP